MWLPPFHCTLPGGSARTMLQAQAHLSTLCSHPTAQVLSSSQAGPVVAEIAGVVGVASMSLQETQLKTFSENPSSPGGRLLVNNNEAWSSRNWFDF